ncbi:hypothetical protein OAS39_13350 [Pirellulales bacterium]|nr:hypothetical protein [Pirellulales bacterium]
MLAFHVNVYACPSGIAPPATAAEHGDALQWRPGQRVFDSFLPVSFEDAVARLQQLPRVDAEPDGFFTFSGTSEGVTWQVSGHLFDFDERLHRVELHGECRVADFESLLQCITTADTELVFELVREGILLDTRGFLRLALQN